VNPFSWIGGLLRGLWGVARAFGPAAPWLFLSFLLVLIGLVLVLLGFDLGDVDAWIEAHGGWFEAVGSALVRLVSVLVILLCLFAIGGAIFDRRNPERPGFGCALLALVVAYFAWFGVIDG
jgi:L-cystine uptake protein TcyP (sodium:dicarboxylate symporter family)